LPSFEGCQQRSVSECMLALLDAIGRHGSA
jgi:hypothetical protein